MKKIYLILFIFFLLVVIYKTSVLAQECDFPAPEFDWGTINADVSPDGTTVYVYDSSGYAFAVHRTLDGCPPPIYPEPGTHQPDEADNVSYTLSWGSTGNFRKGKGEWDVIFTCDQSCGYSCCQNNYFINRTFIIPSNVYGNQWIEIKVTGNYPTGGAWEYTTNVPFFVPDTTPPTCTINYPDAWINSASFSVTLTESDTGGSGIDTNDGDVDINKKNQGGGGSWTGWQDYATRITDFNYTGQHCYFYKFRYQVQDNAGNLSSWHNPGYVTKIDTVNPLANISYPTGTLCAASFDVTLTESDECSGISTGQVQYNVNSTGWQDYPGPGARTRDNFTFTGQDGNQYRFRYRSQDNAGNWSPWALGGTITIDLGTHKECRNLSCVDIVCSGANLCATNADCAVNNPPNTPTLIAPRNNQWINYNPTFQATTTDPDGDNIQVRFGVSGYGNGWGTWVPSGGTSQWGPVNLGTCASYWWRADAQDVYGAFSSWSGWWFTKVDKDLALASINYPTGTIGYTGFNVTLTESDACSGIDVGQVQYRWQEPGKSWTWWDDYPTPGARTTNDFFFTGQDSYCYLFRYRAKDNADNWSVFDEGAQVCIDINESPTATNLNASTPAYCTQNPNYIILSWQFSDPDPGDTQSGFQVQVTRKRDNLTHDSNKLLRTANAYTAQEINGLMGGTFIWYDTTQQGYSWRVRVWDNHDAVSNWANGPNFLTPLHSYPRPDFTYQPTRPNPDEEVQFFDQTTFYANAKSWSWIFQDANPDASTEQNPKTTFPDTGTETKQVTLLATDVDNYSCEITKSINIGLPLPKWREIRPW